MNAIDSSTPPSPLLRPPAAARYVGLSVDTLARYRRIGGGPVFVRLSASAVAYLVADLDAWLASRRRTSTSATDAPGPALRRAS